MRVEQLRRCGAAAVEPAGDGGVRVAEALACRAAPPLVPCRKSGSQPPACLAPQPSGLLHPPDQSPTPAAEPNNDEELWRSVWNEANEGGRCAGLAQEDWMRLALELRRKHNPDVRWGCSLPGSVRAAAGCVCCGAALASPGGL